MNKVFKQKSNLMLAVGFAGLIIVSQLMVMNMGYNVPLYFTVILVILCAVIIWGMLDSDCMIEADVLKIKSGPFNNKIEIGKIEKLITNSRSLFKKNKIGHELRIVYNKNRRMSIFPIEKQELIQALKKINPKIVVE